MSGNIDVNGRYMFAFAELADFDRKTLQPGRYFTFGLGQGWSLKLFPQSVLGKETYRANEQLDEELLLGPDTFVWVPFNEIRERQHRQAREDVSQWIIAREMMREVFGLRWSFDYDAATMYTTVLRSWPPEVSATRKECFFALTNDILLGARILEKRWLGFRD